METPDDATVAELPQQPLTPHASVVGVAARVDVV
jgi:hypothetical protein